MALGCLPFFQLLSFVLLPLTAELFPNNLSLLHVEIFYAVKLIDVKWFEDALGTQEILVDATDIDDGLVAMFLA